MTMYSTWMNSKTTLRQIMSKNGYRQQMHRHRLTNRDRRSWTIHCLRSKKKRKVSTISSIWWVRMKANRVKFKYFHTKICNVLKISKTLWIEWMLDWSQTSPKSCWCLSSISITSSISNSYYFGGIYKISFW